MVVKWEPSARSDIKNQYQWYDTTMGRAAAEKFRNGIIADSRLLERNPMLGLQSVELNEIYGEEIWRSLTSKGKFKIIYCIDDEIIRIFAVWACVRSENLLSRIIKTRK